ncbi:MAG: hypothetical protein J1F68_01185 [Clostridiales bacterium]|nr:hypothetical protein [Clostridiales bacterium]
MTEILQPIQQFNNEFKDKHRALTEEYFDKLVAESGVDEQENAHLMSERSKALNKLKAADHTVQNHKYLRGWLIFLIVVLLLATIVTAVVFAKSDNLFFLAILLPIVACCGAVALILVIVKVLNNKIKHGNSVVDEFKKQVADIESQAWEQMRPLNIKYGWNIPDKLIYNTLPHIQLDKYFDEDKHDYFKHNFGLDVSGKNDVSVYCARSGNSCGNPFLLIRYFVREIVPHTYSGSLTVSWTERYTDSEGKSHTRTEYQTLVATVVKPKPEYYFTTCLYYGNDAAPDLKFSRNPTVPKNASDKKIASLVRSGEKQLEKKSREAVKKGQSFNKLANSEFEVLFGATDRNHETQFRMMFTPLAQQNMVQLLKCKEPYGDDFTFEKNGCENIIYSSHSADLDIDANPAQFASFDLAQARENFINFNMQYFASIYFDFAPLFSIPIYQQERPTRHFGECTNHGNIGDFEMESVANYFRKELLAPEDATTPQILKAVPVNVSEQATLAEITSYAYRGEDRLTYVPEMARNGRTYQVPVHWVEYIPVQKQSYLQMQAVQLTREQYLQSNEASDTTILVGGVTAKLINKN